MDFGLDLFRVPLDAYDTINASKHRVYCVGMRQAPRLLAKVETQQVAAVDCFRPERAQS